MGELVVPEVRIKAHKSLTFATETKILDKAGEGIVEAIVSVSGNRDEDGDVVVPGASGWGLTVMNPKGARYHDETQVVAKTLSAVDVLPGDKSLPGLLLKNGLGGLRVKGQYNLKTQAGADAFESVQFFGDEQEWSVGYEIAEFFIGGGKAKVADGLAARVVDAAGDPTYQALQKKNLGNDADPSRFITQWVVYEWSDVMFGANVLTGTEATKSLKNRVDEAIERIVVRTIESKGAPVDDDGTATLFDQRLQETEESVAFLSTEAHADMKAGRVQARRNESRLRAMADTITSMLDEIKADEDADAEKAFGLGGGHKMWVDEGIEGTYEDTQEDVREAATAAWGGPDVYVSVVGTFPTHAIICVTDYNGGGEGEYYDVPWAYAADGETVTLGAPVPVEVSVNIAPSNEADDQGTPGPVVPKSRADHEKRAADADFARSVMEFKTLGTAGLTEAPAAPELEPKPEDG